MTVLAMRHGQLSRFDMLMRVDRCELWFETDNFSAPPPHRLVVDPTVWFGRIIHKSAQFDAAEHELQRGGPDILICGSTAPRHRQQASDQTA